MILEPQLPITIEHNWDRVHTIYNRLIKMRETDSFKVTTHEVPYHFCTGYDIGSYGRLIASNNVTGEMWYIWLGTFLELALAPWAEKLKKQFADAGLNFCNFVYHTHTGKLTKHIDAKEDNLKDVPQCNVNYVISAEDLTAKSYFEKDDGIHYYPTVVGRAYLIDSSVPHWVDNSGKREMLQMKFHSPFEQVKEYLLSNPIYIK